jgi:hypothetical protein
VRFRACAWQLGHGDLREVAREGYRSRENELGWAFAHSMGQYVSNFVLLTGQYVWPQYLNYFVLFFYKYSMDMFWWSIQYVSILDTYPRAA